MVQECMPHASYIVSKLFNVCRRAKFVGDGNELAIAEFQKDVFAALEYKSSMSQIISIRLKRDGLSGNTVNGGDLSWPLVHSFRQS